ncbi:MAG: hypothetical protein MUF50_01415 [Planctomycetes bacterium]|jgi:type II secretory pathway pseudopilin PulG|nr:hypothetical protein [Planctomycetota bacterium]
MKFNRCASAFSIFEVTLVVAIIAIITVFSITTLNSSREKARDAKRVADITQLKMALEFYYNDAGGYPSDSAFIPGQSLSYTNPQSGQNKVYLNQIPFAPIPPDGECLEENNSYNYFSENPSTYAIRYCLGNKSQELARGVNVATPNQGYSLAFSNELKCIPNCFNKVCGSDGCGGSCGFCSGVCQDGNCLGSILGNGIDSGQTESYTIEDIFSHGNNTGTVKITFPDINGNIFAYISDGLGGFYIGGNFTIKNEKIKKVAHLKSDGSVDKKFAPEINGIIHSLALFGSSLYMGGNFNSVNNIKRNRLAAVNSDNGSLVDSFNPDVDGTVSSLALSGSTLYAKGDFKVINGKNVSQITSFDLLENNHSSNGNSNNGNKK